MNTSIRIIEKIEIEDEAIKRELRISEAYKLALIYDVSLDFIALASENKLNEKEIMKLIKEM